MPSGDPPSVAFTMSHPHDVHLFRNAIGVLDEAGYRIDVFARDKEITVDLLEAYGISHTVLGGENTTKLGLVKSWSRFGYNLLRELRAVGPDLLVAEVGAVTTPVAALLGTDSLVFMDAEHATMQNTLVYPCATRICTSTSFWTEIGEKQHRYDGYQELAYLHPDRFEPDPSVLDAVGLGEDERFAFVRAVGWNAAHDINAGGFDDLATVIERLEAAGVTVVVSSESPLPPRLQSYQLDIEPHRVHDLLYYAELYVGESATMATESAVLGTPAVYVSTLEVGYTHDIAAEYDLIFNYAGEDRQQRGLERAEAVLSGDYETDWQESWKRMIAEKADTTDVIVEQVREMVGRSKRAVIQ